MKTLVIASGKGGTGKTTLTAVFAQAASRNGRVVLADCDVEASNLPIALHADLTSCESFPGAAKAVVDPWLCAGCGACVEACRFSAARLVDMRAVVDPWACEGCGACAVACQRGAIVMEQGTAGMAAVGAAATGAIAFGQLDPGQDLSGKLVTEVRRSAAEMAEGEALLLIDGPPGVGCPVIASVTNADLLLAVAEPSVSGEHDLRRLVRLARQLGVQVVAVLNKANLSAIGAKRVKAACLTDGVEILGEIPFDPALAALLERLAEGEVAADPDAVGPGLAAALTVWEELERRLR